MAKHDAIDPIAFTREDEANGGQIPTRDVVGRLRLRKANRLSGGRRDKLTAAQMKADIAALWRDGELYKDIADKVNQKWNLDNDQQITAHTINYHVKSMLDYWRQKAAARIDERQAAILARFDQIEALAVEAYFASMLGRKTTQKNKQIERARSNDRMESLVRKEVDNRESNRHAANGKKIKFSWADEGEMEALGDSLAEVNERIQHNVRKETNEAGDVKFLNLMFQINRERAKILGLYQKRDVDDASNAAAMMTDEAREQKVMQIIKQAQERRVEQANMLADPAPLGGFTDENEDGKVMITKVNEVPDEEVEEVAWDDDIDEVPIDDDSSPEVEWD